MARRALSGMAAIRAEAIAAAADLRRLGDRHLFVPHFMQLAAEIRIALASAERAVRSGEEALRRAREGEAE